MTLNQTTTHVHEIFDGRFGAGKAAEICQAHGGIMHCPEFAAYLASQIEGGPVKATLSGLLGFVEKHLPRGKAAKADVQPKAAPTPQPPAKNSPQAKLETQAPTFPELVASYQKRGMSKLDAVNSCVRLHKREHAAWLAAGGGSLDATPRRQGQAFSKPSDFEGLVTAVVSEGHSKREAVEILITKVPDVYTAWLQNGGGTL